MIVPHGSVGNGEAELDYFQLPEKTCDRDVEKGVLLNLIFHGRIARADGIDILEKGRLIRIDAEVFPKFLVLGSRGFRRPVEEHRVAHPGLGVRLRIGERNNQLQVVMVHAAEDFMQSHLVTMRRT